MTHTYVSDVQVLIQFAKDQGWDLPDVMEAVERLEDAITEGLDDYITPANKGDSSPNLEGEQP